MHVTYKHYRYTLTNKHYRYTLTYIYTKAEHYFFLSHNVLVNCTVSRSDCYILDSATLRTHKHSHQHSNTTTLVSPNLNNTSRDVINTPSDIFGREHNRISCSICDGITLTLTCHYDVDVLVTYLNNIINSSLSLRSLFTKTDVT